MGVLEHGCEHHSSVADALVLAVLKIDFVAQCHDDAVKSETKLLERINECHRPIEINLQYLYSLIL